MQKAPSSGTGPFGRSSIGGGCSVDPPISQFVTLSFGSRAARWWPSRLVATATEHRVSTTIWSGGAAVGLYLGTGLILAFLVHTHYPRALGLREWIRVILSWPLIFFLRSK